MSCLIHYFCELTKKLNLIYLSNTYYLFFSNFQSLEELAQQSKINYTVVADSPYYEYFKNMAGAEEDLYKYDAVDYIQFQYSQMVSVVLTIFVFLI